MSYYILIGNEKYGPYQDYATAYLFATINFGFTGWEMLQEK